MARPILWLLAVAPALLVGACNQKSSQQEKVQDNQAEATRSSGEAAADSLENHADRVEDKASTAANALENQADAVRDNAEHKADAIEDGVTAPSSSSTNSMGSTGAMTAPSQNPTDANKR